MIFVFDVSLTEPQQNHQFNSIDLKLVYSLQISVKEKFINFYS